VHRQRYQAAGRSTARRLLNKSAPKLPIHLPIHWATRADIRRPGGPTRGALTRPYGHEHTVRHVSRLIPKPCAAVRFCPGAPRRHAAPSAILPVPRFVPRFSDLGGLIVAPTRSQIRHPRFCDLGGLIVTPTRSQKPQGEVRREKIRGTGNFLRARSVSSACPRCLISKDARCTDARRE